MAKELGIPDNPWTDYLSCGYNDIRKLQSLFGLTDDETAKLVAVQETYPMFVNSYYLSLVRTNDPEDPIRRMCIPSVEELDMAGLEDTSGEAVSTVLPGLQHKYSETALVLSTGSCATYCRYCFRRRFVGISQDETVADISAVAAYIKAHREISNVLMSGGDALMCNNYHIRRYLEAFAKIDHVRTIRLATRMPVVLPQRITHDEKLLGILEAVGSFKQLHVMTQFNHPAEITPESRAAVRALLACGVPVHNQTVLLRGVNDDPKVLAQLLGDLAGAGITPYYVFQCRPTIGVKNRFQIPLQEGSSIVEQARKHLDGLAKSFRFILSHDMGKIEVLGPLGGELPASQYNGDVTTPCWDAPPQNVTIPPRNCHISFLFKFHQARDRRLIGRIFEADILPDACWLDEEQLPSAP